MYKTFSRFRLSLRHTAKRKKNALDFDDTDFNVFFSSLKREDFETTKTFRPREEDDDDTDDEKLQTHSQSQSRCGGGESDGF